MASAKKAEHKAEGLPRDPRSNSSLRRVDIFVRRIHSFIHPRGRVCSPTHLTHCPTERHRQPAIHRGDEFLIVRFIERVPSPGDF